MQFFPPTSWQFNANPPKRLDSLYEERSGAVSRLERAKALARSRLVVLIQDAFVNVVIGQ